MLSSEGMADRRPLLDSVDIEAASDPDKASRMAGRGRLEARTGKEGFETLSGGWEVNLNGDKTFTDEPPPACHCPTALSDN